MKTIIQMIAVIFILMAALAAPIAIGIGIYDWVGNDMEFKFALWEGFKSWAIMLTVGLVGGLPLHFWSK